MVSVSAKAHDWFPYECCGGNDCKEVSKWEDYGDYDWKITNPDGVYIVHKKDQNIRPSQDGKRYMCIYQNKVWCLFANLGT